MFGAVLLAAIGIALGFVALFLPGVYLLIRWYFVPQAVVIEGARGPAALSRSSEIVQGSWWRTLGRVVLANVAVAIPALLLLAPFNAIASSTDQAVWALVGTILATSVTTPFVALYSTFLYYDLLTRRTPLTYSAPMSSERLTRNFILLRALRWLPVGLVLPFLILTPVARASISARWARCSPSTAPC